MKYLMGFVATAACALAIDAGAQSVFKWTDADGKVHFGDRAPVDADAEQMRLQSYSDVEVTGAGKDFGARKVTLYTAEWCGICKNAKAHLRQRGVYFLEYDVEKSDTGKIDYRKLKAKGVPVILVGNQRMNGFNAAKLDKLLTNVGYPPPPSK